MWCRRFHAEGGRLVRQVEHTVTDLQLGVPDAAVLHFVHVADRNRAEGVGVPGDGFARVRDS